LVPNFIYCICAKYYLNRFTVGEVITTSSSSSSTNFIAMQVLKQNFRAAKKKSGIAIPRCDDENEIDIQQ